MRTIRPPKQTSGPKRAERSVPSPTGRLGDPIGEALLLTGAAVAVVEVLSHTAVRVPSLTVLLTVVAYVALRNGQRSGLVSAAAVSLYGVWYFAVPGQPFRYTDGDVLRLVILPVTSVVIALIVGTLRRALQTSEDDLRRQRDFSLAIHNNLAEGVYAVDAEGRVTFANPAAEELLGWSEAELLGAVMHDVIHFRYPDGRPYPREACSGLQVLVAGIPYRTDDEAFVRKDGTILPVAYSSAPILTNGRVTGAVVAFRDTSERRRAEEALRQSEAKLRWVTQQMPAHLWTTDADLRVMSVAGSALTRLGIDLNRHLGTTLYELTGSEGERPPALIAAHAGALGGDAGGYDIETAGRVFEARVEPLRDAEDRIVGCLGLALDVTERRRDERRLATQYAVSRVLAEGADLDEAAPRVLRVIGECLGWDYGALWVRDRRAGLLRCVDSWHVPGKAFPGLAAANRRTTFGRGEGLPGRAWETEEPVWIEDAADQVGWPRLRIAAAEGLHGGFALPMLIAGDVSGVFEFFSCDAQAPDTDLFPLVASLGDQIGQFAERKRVEDELKAGARQQAAVAELGQYALATPLVAAVMDEAVALVARTLGVEYCKVLELEANGTALRLRAGVGWKEGAVGRATVGIGTDSQAGYTLASGAPVIVDDLEDEPRFFGPPLLLDHGVISGISVVIQARDRPFGVLGAHTVQRRRFTKADAHFLQSVANVLSRAIERRAFEQRLAEEELAARASRDEAERLEELHQVRTTFIASISHDLRTPLTAARAGLGMLETSALDRLRPDERALVSNARRSTERLGLLIDDLLAFNQLEAGTMRLDPEPIDVRTVVTDAIATVHPLVRLKGQALEADLAEPLPAVGDAGRLEQVVVNVLANAHAHTPPGTRITVSGRAVDGSVRLTVHDDGPGIPEEELEAVFDRFHRLAGGHGGSGLGLAIARGIVELHAGRMWAESEPGQGATFTVTLPLVADRGASCP